MKNLKVSFLLLILFSFASCQPDNQIQEEIPCEIGCLFSVKDVQGTIVYMNCFEKFAIQTPYPDDPEMIIYGVPESVPEEFQVEGKEITFSASFRENTLIPSFPDPVIGVESLFQIDIYSIE